MGRKPRRRETGSGVLGERLTTIGDTPTRMVLLDIHKKGRFHDSVMIEAAVSLTFDELQERLEDSFGENASLHLSMLDQSPDEVPADIRISFPFVLEETIVWHV